MKNKMKTGLFLRLVSFFFIPWQRGKGRFESNCGEERELLLMGTMSASEADGRLEPPPTHFYLQIHRMDYCSRKNRNSFEMNHGIRE